ncbi:hypothetical protein [Bacillus mesophilum]|uniref:Uncharacterized protein n=1 Tax=Bacillus mesophilum TaxID=1071718 RepID=A0A7V7UX32_9BACI|nr:hypothetical protein [Bacillus mesophilum]KAB2335571.1 hypothetical protein F7732_03080 [Bacillus mesophilum]
MEVRWKTEEFIFDSLREAEVRADSIANEIYGRLFDGYITPDCKIAFALSFLLASIPEFKVQSQYDGQVYKVWVALVAD